MKSRVTDLFQIGVMKSATTSLHDYLEQHDFINGSNPKETNFFVGHDVEPSTSTSSRPCSDMSCYDDLFPDREGIRLDSSCLLFHSESSPGAIARYNPSARLILLLRDPVERLVSHYRMEYYLHRTESSIVDSIGAYRNGVNLGGALGYVNTSLYAEHLARWLRCFSPEQFLVLDFENVVRNTPEFRNAVSRFLNVPYDDFLSTFPHSNGNVRPRYFAFDKIVQRLGIKKAVRLLPGGIIDAGKKLYYGKGGGGGDDGVFEFDHQLVESIFAEDQAKLLDLIASEGILSTYSQPRWMS